MLANWLYTNGEKHTHTHKNFSYFYDRSKFYKLVRVDPPPKLGILPSHRLFTLIHKHFVWLHFKEVSLRSLIKTFLGCKAGKKLT